MPANETSSQHEIGLFESRRAAHEAVRDLIGQGFAARNISFFVQASPAERHGPTDSALDAAIEVGGDTGAGLGAATGGVLLGLGLLTVPGVGPLLAAGPIAAAVTGAITGGAFGGFAGSLAGAGISEAQSLAAERQVQGGSTIVVVQCHGRSDIARKLLLSHGAAVEP